MGAVKRADRIAGFGRWTSVGSGAHHEAEWRRLRAVVGLVGALPTRSPYPFADLVFSGTLYVDMVPEEVPVLWGSFSSAVGECPAGAAREAPVSWPPPGDRTAISSLPRALGRFSLPRPRFLRTKAQT